MGGRKLFKSAYDRKLAGVCGGIAEFLGIDSTVVRLATFLLVFFGGLSLWVYIVAAIIMPEPPA